MCPVRPPPISGEGRPATDEWENIADSHLLEDPQLVRTRSVDDADEVDADTGTATQKPPRVIPEPKQPSREEVARHNLTHLPYRSWCPHCVACRRSNNAHRTTHSSEDRSLPIFVSDYAFVRQPGEALVTILVGRLYPSRAVFATVCDVKGPEDASINRLSDFFKESGITKVVYKNDQEPAICAMITSALKKAGREGDGRPTTDVMQMVPEWSAVGESASNGRAERTVQQVEDLLRTYLHVLESRINQRVSSCHDIVRWMVEHVMNMLNRYTVNPDGVSPYAALHGKRAVERHAEFGEKVFWFVPKPVRTKLSPRWRLGTFVGVYNNSNEIFVADSNGDIVKTRSIARVVAPSRWDAEAIQKVRGTPVQFFSANVEGEDSGHIEERLEPHLDADAAAVQGTPDADETAKKKRAEVLTRITGRDLRLYGYHSGCPKCEDLQKDGRSFRAHSEECRLRLYLAFKEADDYKYRLVRDLIEPGTDAGVAGEDLKFDDTVAAGEQPPAANEIPLRANSNHEPDIRDDGRWNPAARQGQPEEPEISMAEQDAMDPAMDIFFPSPDSDNGDDDMADVIEASEMMNALLGAGVADHEAKKFIASLSTSSEKQLISDSRKRPVTFMEVYGRGAICNEALKQRRNLNLVGLNALDLRTHKPDGSTWNFNLRKDRVLARQMIDQKDPDWIIGSPPCTAFALWNRGINYKKMPAEEVRKRISEGRKHLNFMVSIYRGQLARGKHFLHEHPQSAASWMEVGIKSLSQLPSVHLATADQCMYGLTTKAEGGGTAPAKKPTTFMTSSRQMADLLMTRCDKMHTHQRLVSGRCFDASFYPLELVKTILRGMRATTDVEAILRKNAIEHKDVVMSIATKSVPPPDTPSATDGMKPSSVRRHRGGKMHISWDDVNFKTNYLDEYTGDVLPKKLVTEAIVEELEYFNSKVWEVTDRSDMLKVSGHIFVRCRWVFCNKGDHENPDVRARLVACEVNQGDKQDCFYASTPPLEAKRILFSRLAQERKRGGKPLRISFIDIRKAYFNGTPKRPIFMTFPKELGLPSDKVAKLVRCVYGTRDAGAIWEDCYRDALESIGFTSGSASPCCFWHKERNLSCVVHGDDFSTLGLDADLDWLEKSLAEHFELKIRGRIGEGLPGDNEMRILNRIVAVHEDCISYEADPRHVDLLSNSLGIVEANSVGTPGTKDPEPDYDLIKTCEPEGFATLDGDLMKSQIKMPDAEISIESFIREPVSQSARHSVNGLNTGISLCPGGIETKSCLRKSSQNYPVKNVQVDGPLHGKTTFHEVIAYSVIYGVHPGTIIATQNGFKSISNRADNFTGKLGDIMKARIQKIESRRDRKSINNYRKLVVQHQSIAHTDTLIDMISRAGIGANICASLVNTHVPTYKSLDAINALSTKHERRLAFDNAAQLFTTESFSLAVCTQGQTNGEPPKDSHTAEKNKSNSERLGVADRATYDRLCATRTKPVKKKFGPARQGAKQSKMMERLMSSGHVLDPVEATKYRALSARGNFLAMDRVDISYSSKELCREFAQPNKKSYERLKRVGRYLVGVPRLQYTFGFSETGPAEYIEIYSDTDFAGCKESRRSTSGGVVTINGHCVKHWSKTQSTVSLSSGEAELHGIGMAIAQGLGFQALCKDLGFEYKIRVHSDATAAIGIARRRGLGKVRHLDCADLWIQEKVRSGAVTLTKILGTDNPADALTKYVDRQQLEKAMATIGMRKAVGRAKSAPATMGIQQ